MNYNYINLMEEFKNISSKNWIKGINNYTNSAGLTFESLLNKKSDSMYFPDYQGIEIKCTQRYSGYPINLFTLAFDGPSLYQMNEVLNKYGKKDMVYKDRKILIAALSCKDKILVNDKYYFKLNVSEEKQRLFLEVYDLNGAFLEQAAFINFETIKQRLELKLSTLAIVWASKRIIDDILYFRYYKMTIYRLLSFAKFIDLLKNDLIKVDIVGRVSRSGPEKGRQRNKNLVFQIRKEHITELFKPLETYDKDANLKFQIL